MRHVTNEVADNKILPKSEGHDDNTDQNCKSHLINFSLFDALFPNIEL